MLSLTPAKTFCGLGLSFSLRAGLCDGIVRKSSRESALRKQCPSDCGDSPLAKQTAFIESAQRTPTHAVRTIHCNETIPRQRAFLH